MASKPLKNKRHETFCKEYVKELNNTAAYHAAYPQATRKTAGVNGSRLLENAEIKQRIEALMQERNKRTESEADELLLQIRHDAYFDPAEVLSWDGKKLLVRSFDDIPIQSRRMIRSFKYKEIAVKDPTTGKKSEDEIETVIELIFYSREKFTELYTRHLGLLNDKLEIKSNSIEQLILKAKEQQ